MDGTKTDITLNPFDKMISMVSTLKLCVEKNIFKDTEKFIRLINNEILSKNIELENKFEYFLKENKLN